ncbi:MAG: peptidase S41 [Chitinophagaceae bacterium]|nr:peptidase S41 [Chitinophagaceae bacterium]
MLIKWTTISGCCAAILFLISCSASKPAFDPGRKYDPATLEKDFNLFQGILEEYHPSLYWFTSKDSIDHYFDRGRQQLKDSLTEPQFRNVLQQVITQVRCGHTSVRYSKAYTNYLDTAKLKTFPLSIKVWQDTMAVIGNLIRRDTILRRGTIINSINGISFQQFRDTFLNYLVTDAHALNGKYQTLSTRGNFGVLYRNVFGLSTSFRVGYIDSTGNEAFTVLPVYDPSTDTLRRTFPPTVNSQRGVPRQVMVNGARNIQIDTTLSTAYMTVNTFSRGNKLRPFFRQGFREINKHSIRHLIVDVRSNGGGDAGLSTLLTRYLITKEFKIADSLYAIRRSGKYNKYIKKHLLYRTAMFFVTRKKKDRRYHFVHFEKHVYKPKRKNHFDGDIYIITGGNSFSATTLFAKALQHQKNVLIVGEETGGGAYGNTAWMIPEAQLPLTGLRFRLPLFRLVMDKEAVATGRGVFPDIDVTPTVESLKRNIDPKSEKVKQIIIERNKLRLR